MIYGASSLSYKYLTVFLPDHEEFRCCYFNLLKEDCSSDALAIRLCSLSDAR